MKYYTVIYWYTTALRKERFQVKNGSARRLAISAYAAAEIRIKEQITAANSGDPYEILHVEDISDAINGGRGCETGDKNISLSNLRQAEMFIHAKQKNLGMWVPDSVRKKSEWFFDPLSLTVDNVVNEGLRILNTWRYNSSKKNSYQPHFFQKEAINKSAEFFNSGGTDFLLDCVMRFGKCFTSYQIAKCLHVYDGEDSNEVGGGVKRILVITGRPKVKDGWRDDLDHVDFTGWEFIDSQLINDVQFYEPSTNPLFDAPEPVTEVIFASFQGSKKDVSRIMHVIEQKIDLVIIDEAHAYFSQDAIDFVNNLNTSRRLWVSGTPFKAYESGMFNGETDTYRFTLLDLLREKRRVESAIKVGTTVANADMRYTEFPNVQFLIAEYPKFTVDKLYKEESLNMGALLSSNGESINYPDEVNGLLDSLFSIKHRCPLTLGGREIKYPVNAKHVWVAVPAGKDDSGKLSVAAASTLVNAVKLHPLSAKFEPLAIKGNKDQDDVNRHINAAKFKGKGSINISCRSLNTGTKFPDINVIVFLTETSSASEFWQTIGRALQPMEGKLHITIICYSVEMAVTMANKMVEYSVKPNQGHNQIMTEFLSMMPIFVSNGPKVNQLSIDDVYHQLSSKGSVTKSFGDREVLSKDFDDIIMSNLPFFESIPDVNSDKAPSSSILFSSGVKGKNAIKKRVGTLTPKQKNQIDEIRMKVREFLKLIGSVMSASLLYDEALIECSSDILAVNADTINDTLYPGTKEILSVLIESGALNTTILDRKISAYYTVELKDKIHND